MNCKIIEVRDVAVNTKTIRILVDKSFSFKAGQFVMVGFNEKSEKKAYSISSSPMEKGYIELTIKIAGDFSNKLCNMKVGEELVINGPHGNMVIDDFEQRGIVFIAGGSGIAPILGMLKYLEEKKVQNQVYLFYTSRTSHFLIDYEMLKKMDQNNANFHFFIGITRPQLENPKIWNGPVGRINVDTIKEKVGDIKTYIFFLCGTPNLVTEKTKELTNCGVLEKDIKKEEW